jgi:transposase
MFSSGGGDVLFDGDFGGGRLPRGVIPVGAAKTFRGYDQSQSFLLPPSLDDWLPEDHTARFVSEVVDELLDLSAIYDSYVVADGAPPYDPRMMLKVLLYAYSTGVTSSREMERRGHVDVALRWLSANTAPDYRSLSRFRRRHVAALDDLFVQVLVMCAEAGLVKLGRVALDGTKLRASASRHKAMSYDRLGPRIEVLQGEVDALLAEAEEIDAAEDKAYGSDRRGDEVPDELARRETRLVKMRAAKAAIEDDARAKAAEQARAKAAGVGASDDEADTAADTAAGNASPKPSAQRNFTDPEARMMKTNDGFHYAYNAQAVVDEAAQVVIAASLTPQAGDVLQLFEMAAARRVVA